MNKYVLPLVFTAAAVALRTSASPTTHSPHVKSVNHYVAYTEQDSDSAVDTDTDPDADGDYDVFYDRLASDGRWFHEDDYGYVWQPNVAVSETSWRPYSDGHWVWTDRGWFWDSNENFGWATYHYGRWVSVEGVGWVWVPGSRWAPAWVSWRQTDDDDYVGWAPLPPEATFDVNVGFHSWCDSYYDIGPAAFAFIRIGDFGRPSYREFYLPPQQNVSLINRTTNITNIAYNNNVINNYGPQYQRVSQLVQQRTGQTVPNYKINYAAQRQANAAFKTTAQGNQLNVVAPPQRLKRVATVTPQVARQLGKAQVNRGWQNVPPAQAKELRQKFAQQTPVPKTLAPKPVVPAKPQIQAATKGQQQPATEAGKEKQGPGAPLKPFVETPGSKATGEHKQLETEKAKTVQPEKGKPGETAKKPAVVTEEKKAGTEAAAAKEEPKVNQVEKGKVEHAPQNVEAKHAREPAKPAAHGEASKPKKEETKKEPSGTPQAKASHSNVPHESHPQTHVAQTHVAQPHVAQPHAAQPHVAQAPHPKSPPPQPHRATSNGNQKKKEEHKG